MRVGSLPAITRSLLQPFLFPGEALGGIEPGDQGKCICISLRKFKVEFIQCVRIVTAFEGVFFLDI